MNTQVEDIFGKTLFLSEQHIYRKTPFWAHLVQALAYFLGVLVVGLIGITCIGELDRAVERIQNAGHWWVLLIAAYVLTLAYSLCEPAIRRSREEKRLVNMLILYGKGRVAKYESLNPSRWSSYTVGDFLLDRLRVWASFDIVTWSERFPDEGYPEDVFGIVDGFLESAAKDVEPDEDWRMDKVIRQFMQGWKD